LFPNPASSQTILQVVLDHPSAVVIDVLDLAGRKMMTAFSGKLEKGNHSLPLDVSSFSSGNYIVRMTSGQILSQQKLVICK
jgi:hypothetical protein